jgi:hypothetical protein
MRKLLIGAVAVVSLVLTSGASGLSTVASGQEPQAKSKRYKATRAFVVDKTTGAVRMPTQEEVDQVVANLTQFGQQPSETLTSSATANGVEIDVAAGFAGIVLARPAGDGTWETRCVFTLEEGAEFLGLVVDDSIL